MTLPPQPARLPARLPARPSRRSCHLLALSGLVLVSTLLYTWQLGESGWANSFYSAAAQAGSESWKAFFFGASDSAGSITVDKPPLALWPMALSVRVFGLSSWAILVPQALIGAASVALLYASVRRVSGSTSVGLLAGTTLALTPVATLMFRFNNPDALLVLLLIGAGHATLRAIEATHLVRGGRPLWWLGLAGSLIGLAFLTKMLQALLVLPALAAAYALFALLPWWRRLLHLGVAALATVAGGAWWVAIVAWWPSDQRPYIGGSQSNSILELVLGYNGLGRLTGEQVGSVSSGSGWGPTGLQRLFDAGNGDQIAWLLPAALILGGTAVGLQLRRRPSHRPDAAGPDLVTAALTLWLTWLVGTALTFSLMAGIYHPYYTVALAPAVAACVALGAQVCWQQRAQLAVRVAAAAALGITALLAYWLVARDQQLARLAPVLLVAGVAAGVLGWRALRSPSRRLVPVMAGAVLVTMLGGPTAYSLATVGTPHTGAVPSAGPQGPTRAPSPAIGPVAPQAIRVVTPPAVGTLLDISRPTPRLTRLLTRRADDFTWVAAVTGANSASGFQLATRRPVMPIGGFNGTDPAPTIRGFQQLVAAGRIHFYLAGGAGSDEEYDDRGRVIVRTGSNESQRIEAWVARHFAARTVDGVTLYDLTRPS